MKIERSADRRDLLVALIDNDSDEYPCVAVVDRRAFLGIDEITIEIGEMRLPVSDVKELIGRLQAAVKIAEEEAPRRYPYTRRGEHPAEEVLGSDPDDEPLPIELTDDYDEDQIREFRKDLTADQIAKIEQIKARRAATKASAADISGVES